MNAGTPDAPDGADAWREFAAPSERGAAASAEGTEPRRGGRARRSEAQAARRRARRRRSAVVLTLVGLLLVGVGAFAYPVVADTVSSILGLNAEDYGEGDATGQTTEIVIPTGASGGEIASLLADGDVIASRQAFTKVAADNPQAARIQPGTYTLPTRIPAAQAFSALLDPAARSEVVVTIPEGFTINQVVDRVAAATDTPTEEVAAIAEDPEALGLPAEAGGKAEGWFAPATYTFQPGDTPQEILATMVEHTVTRLDEIGVPPEDRQRVLIEASIIEREVAQPEYFGKVARVLENRLSGASETAGRLQMDSTVLYGVGKTGGIPSRADLDDDNPYNTYIHAGLPPTAIGSPGETAIKAALNPEDGDWLYFVTVDLNSGETKFASTIDEHNANVQEFRDWMSANG